MRLDLITVHPGLLESPFSHSILKRAIAKGLVEIHLHNLRDYTEDRHKKTDDYAFGGGAGMVMMAEPIARCIDALRLVQSYDEIIYFSPDGDLLNQACCNEYSTKKNLILLCGHYKGIDERIRENYITREISIGDYVLSGGELAAAVFADSVIRIIPGVLNDETSALSDSFQDNLISPPVYTRPADWRGHKVPDVLLTGNAALIEKWREEKALERTFKRRPGLLHE